MLKILENIKIIKRNFTDGKTIYALSSGHVKSGVAVIRVSGSGALTAINELTLNKFVPKPRYAELRRLFHPSTGDVIDKGLVLWFPGPQSFTGEDVCEFQVHGGIAVINAMLDALHSVKGLRPAQAGEFTRRAFSHGKLDLTEIEGLADLIHAETEAQRKQALIQMNGVLSKLYNNWKNILKHNIAQVEAFIDFSEDHNIEDNVMTEVLKNITSIRMDILKHLNDGRRGEMLRNGVKIAIVGAPNVGKSSLLNALCQKDVSIVTNIAGTTRDIIEKHYNIGGYPVIFADTAGIREMTNDIIENEGIKRTKNYVQHADFIILMIDVLMLKQYTKNNNFDKFITEYLNKLDISYDSYKSKTNLLLINKMDLLTVKELAELQIKDKNFVSCKNNEGITEVISKMSKILEKMCTNLSEKTPPVAQDRHRQHLLSCIEYINAFLNDENANDMAICAQNLRMAMRCLGKITGQVTTDDILDIIFKEFCIGK